METKYPHPLHSGGIIGVSAHRDPGSGAND